MEGNEDISSTIKGSLSNEPSREAKDAYKRMIQHLSETDPMNKLMVRQQKEKIANSKLGKPVRLFFWYSDQLSVLLWVSYLQII